MTEVEKEYLGDYFDTYKEVPYLQFENIISSESSLTFVSLATRINEEFTKHVLTKYHDYVKYFYYYAIDLPDITYDDFYLGNYNNTRIKPIKLEITTKDAHDGFVTDKVKATKSGFGKIKLSTKINPFLLSIKSKGGCYHLISCMLIKDDREKNNFKLYIFESNACATTIGTKSHPERPFISLRNHFQSIFGIKIERKNNFNPYSCHFKDLIEDHDSLKNELEGLEYLLKQEDVRILELTETGSRELKSAIKLHNVKVDEYNVKQKKYKKIFDELFRTDTCKPHTLCLKELGKMDNVGICRILAIKMIDLFLKLCCSGEYDVKYTCWEFEEVFKDKNYIDVNAKDSNISEKYKPINDTIKELYLMSNIFFFNRKFNMINIARNNSKTFDKNTVFFIGHEINKFYNGKSFINLRLNVSKKTTDDEKSVKLLFYNFKISITDNEIKIGNYRSKDYEKIINLATGKELMGKRITSGSRDLSEYYTDISMKIYHLPSENKYRINLELRQPLMDGFKTFEYF